jgi:hypothetical protein
MLKLLPHKFKTIGILAFVIVILAMIGLKLLLPDFVKENKEQLKPLLKSVLILTLLITILSKEKVEDEFINHCRLRAFTFSFLCSVLTGVFSIFWSGESLLDSSGFQIICTQVFTYLFFFSITKSSIFNSVKQR